MKEAIIFFLVFIFIVGILMITDPDKKQRESALIKAQHVHYDRHYKELETYHKEDRIQACIDFESIVNLKKKRNKEYILSGQHEGHLEAEETISLSLINAILCDPRFNK